MSNVSLPDPAEPVSCTLTTKDAAARVLEWQDVQQLITERQQISDGAVIALPVRYAEQLADLARREADCCGFLALDVTRRTDTVELSIRSANADALPVIDALAGLTRT